MLLGFWAVFNVHCLKVRFVLRGTTSYFRVVRFLKVAVHSSANAYFDVSKVERVAGYSYRQLLKYDFWGISNKHLWGSIIKKCNVSMKILKRTVSMRPQFRVVTKQQCKSSLPSFFLSGSWLGPFFRSWLSPIERFNHDFFQKPLQSPHDHMTPWCGSPTPNHYHVKKMAS